MTSAPPPPELPAAPRTVAEALGEIPPRPRLPLPRWVAPLALVCIVCMVPWIVYLALTIPQHSRAAHYDIAWIGFDCAMWAVLASLAVCAWRRSPAIGAVAAVAATMLCVDGWFDVTTSDGHGELVVSLIEALCVELPLALICVWVSVNAERVRLRAYRGLRRRWLRAVDLARETDAQIFVDVREPTRPVVDVLDSGLVSPEAPPAS